MPLIASSSSIAGAEIVVDAGWPIPELWIGGDQSRCAPAAASADYPPATKATMT